MKLHALAAVALVACGGSSFEPGAPASGDARPSDGGADGSAPSSVTDSSTAPTADGSPDGEVSETRPDASTSSTDASSDAGAADVEHHEGTCLVATPPACPPGFPYTRPEGGVCCNGP